MARIVFYLTATVWLVGFGLAAVTAGAPGAVAAGVIGLLGTLAAIAARIGTEKGPGGRDGSRRDHGGRR